MPEFPPPGESDRPAPGRGPLTPAAIDAVLSDFRAWLTALSEPLPSLPEGDEEPVDLATEGCGFLGGARVEPSARPDERWESLVAASGQFAGVLAEEELLQFTRLLAVG